ncbi:MAG: hypothetical protein WA813_24645 [Beijerinckiaceae bacterium]
MGASDEVEAEAGVEADRLRPSGEGRRTEMMSEVASGRRGSGAGAVPFSASSMALKAACVWSSSFGFVLIRYTSQHPFWQ